MKFALPDASPLPPVYDVVDCLTCGCAFADSDASEINYSEYYRDFSKYVDSAVATGGGDHPADHIRLNEVAIYLSNQVSTTTARIADIGCANGGLLKALRLLGYRNLVGLDPSPACVRRLCADGLNAYEFALPLPNGFPTRMINESFDLIVLSHVLEHIFDARALVASLLEILASDGKIYIEVPDASRYERPGYPPFYFFDPEHINHFSQTSLRNLAKALDLSVLDAGQKEIILANGTVYPATYGLLARPTAPTHSIGFDHQLHQSLQRYIAASRGQIGNLRDRILSLAVNNRHLAIWGAGSLSQRLISEDWFPLEKLVAIVDRDSNKVGLNFMNMRIQIPETGLSALPQGTVVCCAAAIAAEQISKQYYAMKLPYTFVNIIEGN
jgi:SAM-dependent methyltransferase